MLPIVEGVQVGERIQVLEVLVGGHRGFIEHKFSGRSVDKSKLFEGFVIYKDSFGKWFENWLKIVFSLFEL